MHEHSLVRTLIGQVKSAAKSQGASPKAVYVQLGSYSGVESYLLSEAWAIQIVDTPWPTARLVIQPVELEINCHQCNKSSYPNEFSIICSSCGSRNTQIVAGREFILEQIVFIH